jgi:hypothetical protein
MKKSIVDAFNRLISRTGLVLTPAKNLDLVHQHDYGSGGYDDYRRTQIHHNKRKIDKVFADAATIAYIADYVRANTERVVGGICHGTRRGFEQAEFSRLLNCPVIGTELSDTATQFPNTFEWDFHEQKPEWVGAFTFGYSNSHDQAFNPRKALLTWTEQLTPDGFLFIEHTMLHSATGSSEMDPFGAHPMVMPYLFLEWGRGNYRLHDILHPPHKKPGGQEIWVFVLKRWKS